MKEVDSDEVQLESDFEGVVIWQPPEENFERPIPYVVDFSSKGELTIAWDQSMKPIENPQVIPPTRIAIDFDVFMSEEMKN